MEQSSGIDELIENAFPSGPRPPAPELGATLRRLSANLARRRNGLDPGPVWARRAAQARDCLQVLTVSVISDPRAATHLGRLDQPLGDTDADLDGLMAGWRVFGCLLYLTGHPDSAAYWWGIAAGAGDTVAAYCRSFQQQLSGEAHAIGFTRAASWTPIAPTDDYADLLACSPSVPALPRDLVHRYHAGPAAQPPNLAAQAELGAEVGRLDVHDVPDAGASGLVEAPGPHLADRLRELAGQH